MFEHRCDRPIGDLHTKERCQTDILQVRTVESSHFAGIPCSYSMGEGTPQLLMLYSNVLMSYSNVTSETASESETVCALYQVAVWT